MNMTPQSLEMAAYLWPKGKFSSEAEWLAYAEKWWTKLFADKPVEVAAPPQPTEAAGIIADLLRYPYPADLMTIRAYVRQYESEISAMAELDSYCTEEYALEQRALWRDAQERAREFIKANKLP